MGEQPLLPGVHAAIVRDMGPVRRLPPPYRRAIRLAPLMVILLSLALTLFGLRRDIGILGLLAAWGLSLVQAVCGIVFIGLAFREAIPGRSVPRELVIGLLALGASLFVSVMLIAYRFSPTTIEAAAQGLFWRYCFSRVTLIGVPLVLGAAWLAGRALPMRPRVVGALYGLGAGLGIDAGWRLVCFVSMPTHVVLAHGGAIVALAGLGIVTADLGAAWRAARRRREVARADVARRAR